MKNEILDEIIDDPAHKLFEKNEKIIWEGSPIFKRNTNFLPSQYIDFSDDKLMNFVLLCGFAILSCFIFGVIIWLFSVSFNPYTIVFILLLLLISLSPRFFSIFKRKRMRYIITSKQIVFQRWNFPKNNYYGIRFHQIKNFVISNNEENYGVIFLVIENPQNIPFHTYDLSNGEQRHQPTLEMIENVNEVGECIKLGIQGKL